MKLTYAQRSLIETVALVVVIGVLIGIAIRVTRDPRPGCARKRDYAHDCMKHRELRACLADYDELYPTACKGELR